MFPVNIAALKNIISIFICTFCIQNTIWSQGNIGIATNSPEPSAVLHLSDTVGKGLLIPRTDTLSVFNYVNALIPPQPIADGLLIFDLNLQQFMYYDGDNNKWNSLHGLTGITGSIGPSGPTGLTGPTGSRSNWRYGETNPVYQLGDECGDYYVQLNTGLIYELDTATCQIWVPVNQGNTYKEKIKGGLTIHKTSRARQTMVMSSSTQTCAYDSLKSLVYQFSVPGDSVFYMFGRAYGAVSKVSPNAIYNYAQFDFEVNNVPTGGNQIVSVSPNGAAPQNTYHHAQWEIGIAQEFFGPATYTVKVIGCQRFSRSPNVDIVIADTIGSVDQANMDLFIMKRHVD